MNKILILLLILISIIACEEEVLDYRDKYTGNYKFEITYSYPIYVWVDSLQMNWIYWNDTSYFYNGFIKKSANSENRILIHWGKDTLCIINNIVYTQTNEIIVDSSGILSYPEYSIGGHTSLSFPAYLRNDTARFIFESGGLGAYETWNVIGIKNK
jgi:hypothetical protein